MNDIQDHFPNCLRKYRRARGLTQQQVAKVLGLKSTGVISRWEKGVCLPDTMRLCHLAILYRTMTDALLIDILRALRSNIRKQEEAVLGDKVKSYNAEHD